MLEIEVDCGECSDEKMINRKATMSSFNYMGLFNLYINI